MADSYNKKEREKKKRKRKQDKAERRKQKKLEGTKTQEFMYVDENGNLVAEKPDPAKKKKIELEEIEISIPKKAELEPEDSIRKGTIKFFNFEKRFGFIKDSISGEDYFVYADNIEGEIGETKNVEFEVGNGPKGPVAINVKVL